MEIPLLSAVLNDQVNVFYPTHSLLTSFNISYQTAVYTFDYRGVYCICRKARYALVAPSILALIESMRLKRPTELRRL